MPRSNQVKTYSAVMKLLHWVIVLCVLCQILIGFFGGDLTNKSLARELMMLHKSIGLSLVALSALFVLVGLFSRKPQWPAGMPVWERFCARVAHVALYALLLLMSISGWCMATASGHTVVWFGLCQVSTPGVPLDHSLAQVFSSVHDVCAWILTAVIAVHVMAALKHQFLERDHILARMLPG